MCIGLSFLGFFASLLVMFSCETSLLSLILPSLECFKNSPLPFCLRFYLLNYGAVYSKGFAAGQMTAINLKLFHASLPLSEVNTTIFFCFVYCHTVAEKLIFYEISSPFHICHGINLFPLIVTVLTQPRLSIIFFIVL